MVIHYVCPDGCVPADGIVQNSWNCARCNSHLCGRCKKVTVPTSRDTCENCPPWDDDRLDCGHYEQGDCDVDCRPYYG